MLSIITELGLRYPPRKDVDRHAHAAQVALLAKDCADLDPDFLRAAVSAWAKRQPFLPRACELRDETLALQRITDRGRWIAPPQPEPVHIPETPALTDEEIRHMPAPLLNMGIHLGEIDPARAERLRMAA